MEAVAVGLGSAFCSTLLMFPAEVCAEVDHARFIGGALMMLASLGFSIPISLKVAQWLSGEPQSPGPLHDARQRH